jgi:hypothetical protein
VVDAQGLARLTDYGLWPLYSKWETSVSVAEGDLMYRWTAPEIAASLPLGARRVIESKEGDVFAFGMVVVEIFTGEVPFPGLAPAAARNQISKGEIPTMPENLEVGGVTREAMEGLLMSCWKRNPVERPTIQKIVGQLSVEARGSFNETGGSGEDGLGSS